MKKDNYKYLIGLIIGVFISMVGAYASTKYDANVIYNNPTGSTLTSTNVQAAIDELAEKYKTVFKDCPSNLICKLVNTGASKIIKLYENGTKTNVTTAGGETITQVTSEGLMQDSFGNIRYYGASPNNYVKFNDELWRIISIGNVKSSESDTEGETRIKIIRSTSYGDYAWDSSNTNIWSAASLKTTLNGTYYNALSTDVKNMLDDALYYLGGSSTDYNLYADDYYTFERGTTVYTSSRPTKWTGILALMYPSDYMYAADLNICKKVGHSTSSLSSDYRDSTCTGNNWLFNSASQWTLSPYSGSASAVFFVYSDGTVHNNYNANYTIGVRPVAYLKSSVKISGGSGTEDQPYTLSLS